MKPADGRPKRFKLEPRYEHHRSEGTTKRQAKKSTYTSGKRKRVDSAP